MTEYPVTEEVEEVKTELNSALEALARVSNLMVEDHHVRCDNCEGLRANLEESREEVEALIKAKNELEERLAEMATKGADSVEAMVDMDRMSRDNQGLRETLECRDLKVSALEFQLKEECGRHEDNRRALEELQCISQRLQEEVLSGDKEKIRLSEMLKQTKEENEVLGKVMERITKDYEELKRREENKTTEKYQTRSLPEDAAKIQALRNTARALESENDLLSRERENLEQELHRLAAVAQGARQSAADLKTELAAKDSEREAFAEHFQKLEEEKEAAETARKVMEKGLDDALAKGREAEDKIRVTNNLALSLEQTARMAEEERAGEAKRRNELEHKLAEQDSIYEAKISDMQRELLLRLEEIDANKEEETKAVKQRYIQMFNEKAEELHAAREDIKKYQREATEKETLISDLQEREEELQNLLGKTRAALEDEYKDRCEEVRAEVRKAEERTKEVEKELQGAKWQHEELQESYRASVQSLARRLHEITAILREHQEEQEGERVKARLKQNSEDEEVMFGLHIPTSESCCLQANSVSSEDSAVVIDEGKLKPREESGKDSEGGTSEGFTGKSRKRNKARRRRNKHASCKN